MCLSSVLTIVPTFFFKKRLCLFRTILFRLFLHVSVRFCFFSFPKRVLRAPAPRYKNPALSVGGIYASNRLDRGALSAYRAAAKIARRMPVFILFFIPLRPLWVKERIPSLLTLYIIYGRISAVRYRRHRTMSSSEKRRRFCGRNRRFFAAIATPIAR